MSTIEQHIDLIQQANKITKQRTLLAAGAGLIPLPIVDTAALLAVQLTMIQSIATLYGIEFKKHIVKSLIGSLIGSVSSVGLVKLIPGFGTLLGGAAAATTGAAATFALGRVFTQHFDQGGTLLDFDPITSREYFHTEYEAGRLFVGESNPDLLAAEAAAAAEVPVTSKEMLQEETKQLQNELAKLQQEINLLLSQKASKPAKKVKHASGTIKQEDLTLIEGIGKKIDQILKKAGVKNLADLAAIDIDQLEQIFRDAGPNFNFVDPTSWPKQAKLAAEGKIEALKALQEKLNRGISKEK